MNSRPIVVVLLALTAGCGARSIEAPGELEAGRIADGEAGRAATSGGAGTGGGSLAGGGGNGPAPDPRPAGSGPGGMSPSPEPDPARAGMGGISGAPQEPSPGGAGAGGQTTPVEPQGGGGGGGAESCAPPWWGTPSLDGIPGLLTCPDSYYEPAMLAYGQTEIPECFAITGPAVESRDAGALSCCYHLDERACGTAYEGEFCVDVPYFGDGTTQVEVPVEPVAAPPSGCPSNPVAGARRSLEQEADGLLSVWLPCDGMPLGLEGDALLLQGDGTYRTYTRDAEGHLEPSSACRQTGIWGLATPGQLYAFHDGGMMPFFVDFAADDVLLVGDFNGKTSVFVRIAE